LAANPQAAALVEEIAHLSAHIAKACGRTKDYGVCLGQMLDARGRYMGEGCARCSRAAFLEYVGRNQLGNLKKLDFDVRDLACAGRYRLRHVMNVSVHAVENHLGLSLPW
jgi:hypothetical protein